MFRNFNFMGLQSPSENINFQFNNLTKPYRLFNLTTMKKFLLLLSFAMSGFYAQGQCGNLYIAGAIDGPLSGGTPKGVQLCATADIADMSIYGLGSANNGGGSDGQEFTFDATSASAGDCFWVASESSGFNNFFGFAPCYTTGAMSINGDDAIELFCSGAVVDLFGDINTDGTGECWDHVDGWAANNTGAPNNGAFDCADWTFSGPNALDGESDNGSAANPYPNDVPQVCPSVPTPVTLSDFGAKAQGQFVQIVWATASEIDNDFFQVEHSTDGRNFSKLSTVKGAGTSFVSSDYEYLHETPAKGVNYYRLAQVDFDGATSYSEVAEVSFAEKAAFSIRPTLAQNEITVSFAAELNTEVQLSIYDLTGRIVAQNQFDAQANTEIISVSDLQAGHYLVRVIAAGQSYTERFIKQ